MRLRDARRQTRFAMAATRAPEPPRQQRSIRTAAVSRSSRHPQHEVNVRATKRAYHHTATARGRPWHDGQEGEHAAAMASGLGLGEDLAARCLAQKDRTSSQSEERRVTIIPFLKDWMSPQ